MQRPAQNRALESDGAMTFKFELSNSAEFRVWETETELEGGVFGRSVIREAINDLTPTHHSKISVMWWSVCGLVNMGVEEV